MITRHSARLPVVCVWLASVTLLLAGAGPAHADLTYEHRFRFYIHPDVATDLPFARIALPKYVQDMNTILAKNTPRRLVFDPSADIIVTTVPPVTGGATPPLPTEGFDIIADVRPSTGSLSYGGSAGSDATGAGVLARLYWTRIYDPDTLEPNTGALRDYWIQINNMLHEIAHVFGAGIGEYYSQSWVPDLTGEDPHQPIHLGNPDDPFWSVRSEYFTDPLLLNVYNYGPVGNPVDRASLLEVVRFSPLTAAVLFGPYRGWYWDNSPLPDLEHIALTVRNIRGAPVAGAHVKIWNVRCASPWPVTLMVEEWSDDDGRIVFAWGGDNIFNNFNNLRLIKISADGFYPAALHISGIDAQRIGMVTGESAWNVDVTLDAVGELPDTIAPSVSIVAPTRRAMVSGVVKISALATDDRDVEQVGFLVDGVNAGKLFRMTGDLFEGFWNASQVAEGLHGIEVFVVDAAGNKKATGHKVQVVARPGW